MTPLPLAVFLSLFATDASAGATGPVIVRDYCFGATADEAAPTTGASASPSKSRSAAAPARATPAPPPAVLAPMPTPGAASAGPVLDTLAGAAMAESPYAEEAEVVGLSRSDDRARDAYPPPRGPAFDWGGTSYLSNDDSMSLASAQRLLWAVDRDAGFDTSQVRPHELLNYFSFDTDEVVKGRAFSVAMSAERNGGDTLSLAMAVKGATPEPEPLDLTLVLDRSCSMADEGRMDYTKRGLRQMAGQLARGDRVDVVLFDHQVCVPLENFVVGRDDPGLLKRTIDRMQPQGSTDLDGGLRQGYEIVSARPIRDRHGRNQRVMLITDALLNTGNVDTDLVSEVGRAFDEEGIRLTGIGVGTDFNDEMLDKLTEKGKGAYVFLGSEAVVDRVFGVGFPSLVQTIAHDVQFELRLPDSLAMERFYGEEISTDAADVQPIHYFAGTSQLFLQDLAVSRSLSPADRVELLVHFRDARTGEPGTEVFRGSVGELLAADGHNVDKAQALMAWTDLLLTQAMGGSECGEPLRTFGERAADVAGDAEIAYVSGLVGRHCGVDPSELAPRRVSYKVRVDSDIPIAEVAMRCSAWEGATALSGSDSVARFDALPGTCTLSLQGNVAMTTEVEVPETGGQLRCLVRGGRMSCS